MADEAYKFANGNTILSGLGCGLLAGAAVAASATLTDLAYNGAQVVRVAFRMGVHVYEVSSLLEAPQYGSADHEADSWAFVIPGVTLEVVQAEVDAYNKTTVCPLRSPVVI